MYYTNYIVYYQYLLQTKFLDLRYLYISYYVYISIV